MMYYVIKEVASKVNSSEVVRTYNAGRPVMVTEDIEAAKTCFNKLVKKHVPCILAGENPFKASPVIYALKAAKGHTVDSYYSGLQIIRTAEWKQKNSGMKTLQVIYNTVDIFFPYDRKITGMTAEEMFEEIEKGYKNIELCVQHRFANGRVNHSLIQQIPTSRRNVYPGRFNVICDKV